MGARVKSAALLIAIAWLYLYSFPYFPKLQSANELPRVYLTWAMVEEGRFAIDTGVERWGTTVDVSPVGDHQYSNKAPGSSFLAVPAYVVLRAVTHGFLDRDPTLGEMLWTCRVFTGVLPTLGFLILLGGFLRRFAEPDGARLALVGYALGSMAMAYSVLFIAHQLSAVCIGTAYILITQVVEDERAPGWLFVAGAAAGAAPLVDYQAAFAGVPVAVYLLITQLGPSAKPRRWGRVGLCVAGSLIPIALLLYYHWRAFGSPLKTGYDYSQTFAHFHQAGFLGMTGLRSEAFWGSTFAADNGLFFLCPMLLAMVPGWVVLARRGAIAHVAVSASVVVIYLAFISSINFWRGGWQMGPRYITAMLPFAMVPVAAGFDAASRHWLTRALAVAVVIPGVVIYGLSCALFPYFPERFYNPFYEVTVALLGDGLAPYNLGWLLGLTGVASLVPYLAVLVVVVAAAACPTRAKWRSALLGTVAAGLIVGSYGLIANDSASYARAADRAYQFVVSTFPR